MYFLFGVVSVKILNNSALFSQLQGKQQHAAIQPYWTQVPTLWIV
jgi:hypothetical protein